MIYHCLILLLPLKFLLAEFFLSSTTNHRLKISTLVIFFMKLLTHCFLQTTFMSNKDFVNNSKQFETLRREIRPK